LQGSAVQLTAARAYSTRNAVQRVRPQAHNAQSSAADGGVSRWTPLVPDLWPNHSDYAHLCRIDEHDLIVHLSELVWLGLWVGGDDVVRERVKLGDQRQLPPRHRWRTGWVRLCLSLCAPLDKSHCAALGLVGARMKGHAPPRTPRCALIARRHT
jgi:hypothetical protein